MLPNAYLLANFGIDTAENEPAKFCKNCQLLVYIFLLILPVFVVDSAYSEYSSLSSHTHTPGHKFRTGHGRSRRRAAGPRAWPSPPRRLSRPPPSPSSRTLLKYTACSNSGLEVRTDFARTLIFFWLIFNFCKIIF